MVIGRWWTLLILIKCEQKLNTFGDQLLKARVLGKIKHQEQKFLRLLKRIYYCFLFLKSNYSLKRYDYPDLAIFGQIWGFSSISHHLKKNQENFQRQWFSGESLPKYLIFTLFWKINNGKCKISVPYRITCKSDVRHLKILNPLQWKHFSSKEDYRVFGGFVVDVNS